MFVCTPVEHIFSHIPKWPLTTWPTDRRYKRQTHTSRLCTNESKNKPADKASLYLPEPREVWFSNFFFPPKHQLAEGSSWVLHTTPKLQINPSSCTGRQSGVALLETATPAGRPLVEEYLVVWRDLYQRKQIPRAKLGWMFAQNTWRTTRITPPMFGTSSNYDGTWLAQVVVHARNARVCFSSSLFGQCANEPFASDKWTNSLIVSAANDWSVTYIFGGSPCIPFCWPGGSRTSCRKKYQREGGPLVNGISSDWLADLLRRLLSLRWSRVLLVYSRTLGKSKPSARVKWQ